MKTTTHSGLRFGPFSIPDGSDALFRGDEVVPLEPRVVRVLRYLAENRGRVVSKDELLERVWAEVFTTDDVVKNAVWCARRALGDDAKKPGYLETLPRRGYRFVAAVSRDEGSAAGGAGAGRAAAGGEAARAGNLPAPLSTFVGRGREREDLDRALAAARLVTLVGPGGVGKTRLALACAAGAAGGFRSGAWFVELDAVDHELLVPGAVARSLGVRESFDRSALDALADALADWDALVVLDNCEHVLDAAAGLASGLLARCPGLRVLATSREALGVPGERVYPVPTLEVPGETPHAHSPEALERCDSVRLFVDRAREGRPGFAVTADNADAVARLCRRLEGIPLAVELAAARAKVLSVAEILERMEDRFRLLTGGARAPARHRTLRAAIEWSCDQLDPRERAVFERLSVFRGGCGLDAAEAVCGGDAAGAGDPDDVLDVLTRLVEKSLVVVGEDGGRSRFRMLETVREHAAERLAASGDGPTARDRHARFYAAEVDRAGPELTGPSKARWLSRLEADRDNVRAMLDATLREDGDASAGARACAVLTRFWHVRGYAREGLDWLERALALPLDARARAEVSLKASVLAGDTGDFGRALAFCEAGLAAAREADDPAVLGEALRLFGTTASYLGRAGEGRRSLDEAAAIFERLGDELRLAGVMNGYASAALSRGDYDEAAGRLARTAAIYRRMGDGEWLARTLNNLTHALLQLGRLADAADAAAEVLALSSELAYPAMAAFATANLGEIALRGGDPARAVGLFADAAGRFRALGDRDTALGVLDALARAASALGHHARALTFAEAARALRERAGLPAGAGAAPGAEAAGLFEAAARGVGRSAAERARTAGRALTFDAAVDAAARYAADPAEP